MNNFKKQTFNLLIIFVLGISTVYSQHQGSFVDKLLKNPFREIKTPAKHLNAKPDSVDFPELIGYQSPAEGQLININKSNGPDDDNIIISGENRILFSTSGFDKYNFIPSTPPVSDTWNSAGIQQGQNGPTNTVTAVGQNGNIVTSTDKGNTWTQAYSGSSSLNGMVWAWCPATFASWAFAVGDNNTFLRSEDGTVWQLMQMPYQYGTLYDIFMYNNADGIIVGDYGAVYKVNMSGSQVSYVENIPTQSDLHGVVLTDENNGWAVGKNGAIIHTTNGGLTWTTQQSGTHENLNGVDFSGPDSGLVAGNNGKIIYTTNGGNNWNTYETGYNTDFNDVGYTSDGYIIATGDSGKFYTNKPPVKRKTKVDKKSLYFNAYSETESTRAQKVFVQADSDYVWSALVPGPDIDGVKVNPKSGTGNRAIEVSVDYARLQDDQQTVYVVVSADELQGEVEPDSFSVSWNKRPSQQNNRPFGSFETPQDGATVSGSVPVTGWALDDIGVEYVKIYNGSTYIGDAAFTEGSRPDIEGEYPDYPQNYKAGWGYTLQTNFLPNGGNGTYTFEAIATDGGGKETSLGTKTITCDNQHAVKPFGAIDTPEPGGTVSGSNYRNAGWALTPQPNSIPSDGSTISVQIDGETVGSPVYSQYRKDIENLFPDLENSNGAFGYFDFDTHAYNDGVHSIQWTITDNAGNSERIGSRYFTIENVNDVPSPATNWDLIRASSDSGSFLPNGKNLNKTQNESPYIHTFQITNKGVGILTWNISVNRDWISCNPISGSGDATVTVTLDPAGLNVGTHLGQIAVWEGDTLSVPARVDVMFDILEATEPPFGIFEEPGQETVIDGMVTCYGWALDDVGVASLKIYLKQGEELTYMGDAVFFEADRVDINAFYSHYPFAHRAVWTYDIDTDNLGNGDYTLIAEATDFEGNSTQIEGRSFTITDATDIEHEGDESGLPTEMKLWHAYPNPFNPSTNIKYDVSETAEVSLTIFDVLGRKVTTLIENEHKNRGRYQVTWNSDNSLNYSVSSGIYFVVMKAGNFVQTRKLILLR